MIDQQQKKNATRFILMTVFAYAVGFGIIMPVLPNLIVELEGVSMSEATAIGGYIAVSYAVFQFLLGPLVGNLGDRFGRRPVFLFSLAGFSIDFFLMGFAPNIIWLFIGRSIAGGLGAIFGPANAAMADISAAEDRAKSFGMVGTAFGIGFIIGPALGGALSEFGSVLQLLKCPIRPALCLKRPSHQSFMFVVILSCLKLLLCKMLWVPGFPLPSSRRICARSISS